MAVDKNKQFATGKKFASTEPGSDSWWYGGSQVGWSSKQEAFDNIPEPKRAGLTIGVLENDKVVEYIWHNDDVTDNGLVLKSPESSGDLTTNDAKVLATTEATFTLKGLIDNLTFLDKDVPPVLIDAQSGDGINDTIRFTFKGGTTVDLNAELFVNLDTFKQIRYKASNKFILELVNVDNSIDELNLETILQEYVRIDNVTQYLSETVYYLDNTIVDSSESQANNVNKPYKDLPELLQALPPNDGRPIVIFSLTESTYTGAILPNRNLIFDARKSLTIDFTGINTAVPANGGNTGRLIENSSVIVETSVFHFVEGKVNLISTTNDAMQIFNTGDGVSGVKYTGTLGKFDFQSLSGTNASLDRIFGSRIETDFTINEFVIYRQKGFNFKENSNITIKKLTVKGTNTGVDASDNRCTFNIEDINLAVTNASITFVDKSIINIHKITGTGQVTTYSSTVHLNFVNCEIANTANVIFSGGIMSGNIISGSENVSHAAAAVFDITFKDFKGSIDKINLRNTVASFEGNNKINIRNNFINIHTSDNTERDVAIIKNGLTVLDFTTPANTFISNPLVNRKVNIHSELQTNCTDVSDYVYYSFNAIRGVEVQDENGISKWIDRKLKFANAIYNTAENTIIIPITPIERVANLIIGGMGSTITNSTILATYLTLDVVNILDFQVINNTVYAIINKDYLFNPDAFKDNLDITSYIDKDGFCLKLSNNAFTGCDNLETLSIPTPIYDFLFEGTPMLDISTLKNELITEIKANTFRNVAGDTSFKLSFPLLETLGSTAFRNVGFYVDLPNFKTLNTGLFGVFQGFSGTLNAPKLESLGDPAVNKYTFHQCTNTAILILNYKLKTANNGQPDADLVIAEANGATIIYVGYLELFDEITKLNLRKYENDAEALANNIQIGEPYVNSLNGNITLVQDGIDNSNYLKYVEVSASRNLLPTDNGKALVVTATGILLTIPATGLQDDFNCTITPTTGNDATINVGSVTADENGLTIAPQEMKSIGRLGSTYIIRP